MALKAPYTVKLAVWPKMRKDCPGLVWTARADIFWEDNADLQIRERMWSFVNTHMTEGISYEPALES